MRSLIVFAVLAAILHTTSALPYNASFPFLSLTSLPDCARSCTNLLKAATNCLPPTVPISNKATYVDCFCQSQWLRSLNNIGGICHQHCDKYDEAAIGRTYSTLCGVPSPYATRFPSKPTPTASLTSLATLTSSIHIASTTSTSSLLPAPTFVPTVEAPHNETAHHETWGHKHWKQILEFVLIPIGIIIVALFILHRYARYTRVRAARNARDVPRKEQLRRMEEGFREWCLRENIPLQTVDNSLRGRLGRSLKRSEASCDDRSKIANRRTRRRNISISTAAPLLHPSPPQSAQGDSTPRRPASARTVASSFGQRSASSPLSPYSSLAPPLPIRPSTPRTPATPRSATFPRTPATPRSATFSQAMATPRMPHVQRSISSPFTPTSPSSDIIPPLPTRSLGGRSSFGDTLRDIKDDLDREEALSRSISSQSLWKAQRLRGGQ